MTYKKKMYEGTVNSLLENDIIININHLKKGRALNSFDKKRKFWYYDLLLLDILFKNNGRGQYIFETLFKNRPPQLIFKFLDEETSFWEDLKIISGCPKKEFIRAFVERIF